MKTKFIATAALMTFAAASFGATQINQYAHRSSHLLDVVSEIAEGGAERNKALQIAEGGAERNKALQIPRDG